jgi:D-alanine transaminase/branched-chain amino acid aminotransferase
MKCIINGNVTDPENAFVPATDLTLRRGYGLFDFFRVHGTKPLYLEEHLDRLFRGISILRLETQWSRQDIKNQVNQLVSMNDREGITGIRIVVTGGDASDGFTPATANVIITQEHLKIPDKRNYTEGTTLMTHSFRRELPEVKSVNYLLAVYMAPLMHEKGATEILFHSEGKISECTRSNVFCIRDGALHTPVTAALKGITRGKILDFAGDVMPVSESDFSLDFLLNSDEVFITSTIKRIIPVTKIDDRQLSGGMPGPITSKLMDLLQAKDEAYLRR